MSDLDNAISPSEAARILSNSRHHPDEEQSAAPQAPEHFGLEATERGQGFEPMTVASPIQKELEGAEPVDSVDLGKKILEFEAQVAEPIERSYHEIGGEHHGRPIDERKTVSAEQAAHDVNLIREAELQQMEAWEERQVQDAIDALRASDQQPEQQQAPQTEAPAVQPEQQTQQADDPVVKALSDPKVLAAFNDELGRHSARADQVEQHYAAVTAANAQSAYANLLASFPEVANVRPDQLGTALQVLAQSDPAKAQAIARHVQTVTQLTAEAQKAQAAQVEKQQGYARLQWEHQARQADNAYEIWAAENLSAGVASEIQNEALNMLREDYGLNDAAIARLWNTDMTLRSFAGQRLLADAARYRMAQRSAASKVQRPIPVVQRPGSPLQRGSEQEYSERKLNERIDRSSGRDQLRAAAELVAQRRARNAR